jgi:hypothetical protein
MGAGEFTPKFVRWWLRRQFGPCDPRSVLVGGDGADLLLEWPSGRCALGFTRPRRRPEKADSSLSLLRFEADAALTLLPVFLDSSSPCRWGDDSSWES